jgi:hypothetical protein
VTLNQAIPATPVRDATAAVTFYRGFETFAVDLDGNLTGLLTWVRA